ncbi:unnamed protein product [Blepharisma stoltei]|uniref:Uncharacterized protein n=1 Tax=Blepharisma stoltei TaxID=1481888 RepID=A0AAU9IRT2_9CILI|nr:unnamed protein product [Blepharisma stoltei]
MSWFSRIKSENIKAYLRGVKILEEKQQRRYRKLLYLAAAYLFGHEIHRTFFQEEWERKIWVPNWVLYSRREHYINTEYVRLREGYPTTFTFSNWDPESKMIYHVDLQGNHNFEKIVLPPYHYGALKDPNVVEHFSRLAAYNLNRNKRYDLDNYLRHKTVTLGDWITAVYYYFNILTRSFDPFWYKPEFYYKKEREMIALNFQRDNKPDTIKDIVKYAELKLREYASNIS